VETLEHRHLPSGIAGIASTQPSDGAVLVQPPQELDVTFDPGAVPAQIVPIFMSSFDVQLERVNGDGSRTPIFDPNNPPAEESDSTGYELIVPIQAPDAAGVMQDLTLQPGTYQVDLVGGSSLTQAASGAFSSTGPNWDWTQDQTIAQFTILGQGATLGGATDLGTIGSTATTAAETDLDPADFQSAVDLYKFTLPQGNNWQLSVQVAAHAIGSPLKPALSLFDAQGDVLATRDAGTGTPSDPNDPYLLTGLPPGTYYIGISGEGNLPGTPSGYDPVTGTPGIVGLNQPGGSFRVDLTANAILQPTSVVSSELDHADPLDWTPTGVTLTFSGPIDLSPFRPDQPQQALVLVDSTGRTWPSMATSYDTVQHRFNLNFDGPLPAGTYSLVVPAQGGLTDVAGQPVVGPPGNPPDVLATWTVAPATVPSDPGNLGIIWPGVVNQTWAGTTITRTTELAPGQEASFRFVTMFPGIYDLQDLVAQGQVAARLEGPGGSLALDPGNLHNYMDIPTAGEYRLVLTSLGSQPASIQWTLKAAAVDWELIIYNGVGQAPALSLSLANPGDSSNTPGPVNSGNVGAAGSPSGPAGSPSSSAGSPSGPTGSPSGPAGSPSSSTEPSPDPSPSPAAVAGRSSDTATTVAVLSANTITGTASPMPTGLLVTVNTGVIGLPAPGAPDVAAVGPTAPGGSIALAYAGSGLPPGIRSPSADSAEPVGDGAAPPLPAAAGASSVARAEGPRPTTADAEHETGRADAIALARADWLVRLAARIGGAIAPGPAEVSTAPGDSGPLIAAAMAPEGAATEPDDPAGSPSGRRRPNLVHADLGGPLSLIVAAAVVYRLRTPLQNWRRRRDRQAVADRRPPRFPGRGPHPSTIRPRTPHRIGGLHSPQRAGSYSSMARD
jgi:hypothetical protein